MVTKTNVKVGIHARLYNIDCYEKKEQDLENGATLLSARCRDSRGLLLPSSVIVPAGFSGEIINCNGKLSLDHC
jgi:hypothetical protein